MMLAKGSEEKNETTSLVAIGIDKDKGSQYALKYASDNLLTKGQTVILIHVKVKTSSSSSTSNNQITENLSVCNNPDPQTKELFLPFRIFCARKDIQCKDVVLEETDIARAVIQYVTHAAIEVLVVGASTKNGFLRFRISDIPGTISKGAPDFCSVYIISKGKISSMKSATGPAPAVSSLQTQILSLSDPNENPPQNRPPALSPQIGNDQSWMEPQRTSSYDTPSYDEPDFFISPFTRKGPDGKQYKEPPLPDSDISFVSSDRPSVDRMFGDQDLMSERMSSISEFDFDRPMSMYGRNSVDYLAPPEFSLYPHDHATERMSTASQPVEDVEAEMRRLKMELKQTMEMYSTACKEALSAKEMANELQQWKKEEERRLEEARMSEEAAMAVVQREKDRSKGAIEAAEAAKRVAELEAQKRVDAEMKALKESRGNRQGAHRMSYSDIGYRKYTIEEIEAATKYFSEAQKVGEGGYGPVYRGFLDHTPVAIKVLRPDAAQGKSQFHQEVEVLSCIRHPNMVLLLGACPEYGCLVYEFMANGSLEDRLFQIGNTPPLSWQIRFQIAAEIGTGLLFLHQTKPEPLVHRDLKPANILLDRNYVSKISDVGLARLVPPSVADNVTQYRMTSTAGTFCYIDPEYQQTGMLGIKSDIYSLGIMFLQIITGKSPMGLTHHVEDAMERGALEEMLDPAVPDWPVEEALSFAKLSLQCAELRRKDRPDLGKVVLPELNRLRELAEEDMDAMYNGGGGGSMFHSAPVVVGGGSGQRRGGGSLTRSRASISRSLPSRRGAHS